MKDKKKVAEGDTKTLWFCTVMGFNIEDDQITDGQCMSFGVSASSYPEAFLLVARIAEKFPEGYPHLGYVTYSVNQNGPNPVFEDEADFLRALRAAPRPGDGRLSPSDN